MLVCTLEYQIGSIIRRLQRLAHGIVTDENMRTGKQGLTHMTVPACWAGLRWTNSLHVCLELIGTHSLRDSQERE